MRTILSLAGQTLLEFIRGRILTSFLAFLVVLAWGSLIVGGLDAENRIETAMELALSLTSAMTALLGILLGVRALGEISTPAAHPVLASGIGRSTLWLSRWVAVALLSAGAAAAAPIVLIGLSHILDLHPANTLDLRIAILFLPLETLVLISAAAAFSTLLPAAPAVSLALGYWAIALMHHHPLRYGSLAAGWMSGVIYVAGLFLPDVEVFNPRVHESLPPERIAEAFLHSAAYSLFFIVTGLFFYRRKDL